MDEPFSSAIKARVEFLKRHYVVREDCFNVQPTWADRPFKVLADNTLDPQIYAHLTGINFHLKYEKKETSPTTGEPYTKLVSTSCQIRAGVYITTADNSCKFAVIDLDGNGHAAPLADPEDAALKILAECALHKIPAYPVRSGGGEGWHITFFFNKLISAKKVRKLLAALTPSGILLRSGEEADPEKSLGIEYLPKQDRITKNGYGTCAALPEWHGAKKGNWFHALTNDQQLIPYAPLSFDTISEEEVDKTIAEVESRKEFDSQIYSEWRKEALKVLPLDSVYGEILLGENTGDGWTGARDPDSPTGDRHRSAGVATGAGEAERGTFHSFRTGQTISVFDFIMDRGMAQNFKEACQKVAELSGVPLPKLNKKNSASKKSEKETPLRFPSGAFPDSDYGNAQRLVKFHGNNFRFFHDSKKWFIYDKRWLEDKSGQVMRYAKRLSQIIYKEASETKQNEIREALGKWAHKSEFGRALREAMKLAESEPGISITVDRFDVNPLLLNVANGTLDLVTGDLLEHSRDHLITKLAPVEFRPAAKCPTWLTFLDQILNNNKRLINFLQVILGYSLTGNISEQVMFVLYGSGANGKSTFLNTSRFLLGDYAQQTPADTLMVRDGNKSSNDLARLCGTRFVSAVETEEGRRLSEVLIKQLTGGDPIVARFLFHEFFEFIPQFKIFLATNHRPEIHGTDEAIWRRIRLIPFEITIPEKERDKNLESKLRSELSGILNWAVEGCLAWRRDGLQAPEEVKKATTAYRLEMDSLASFFEDRCLIDSSLRVPAKDLYAAYQAWCNDNAEREVSSTTFGKRLKERQFTPKKTGSVRWWYGIGLASTDPSDGTRLSNGTRLDTDSHAEEENSSYAKNNAGSRPNVSHASHFSEDSIDLAQLDDLWNSTETKVEVHS